MTPLFDRLEALEHKLGGLTETEIELLKVAVIQLAMDEPDPTTDAVGTDGRDLVLHARDACDAAGVEWDEGEDGE